MNERDSEVTWTVMQDQLHRLAAKLFVLKDQIDKLDEKLKSHDSSIWALAMDSHKEISSVDLTPEALAALQEALKQYQPKPTYTRGHPCEAFSEAMAEINKRVQECRDGIAKLEQTKQDKIKVTQTTLMCKLVNKPAYTRGQEVEVKRHGVWNKGLIAKRYEDNTYAVFIDCYDTGSRIYDNELIRPLQKESK